MMTIHFKEIESTNTYCKEYDTGEDMLVFADRQTAGRGTKGRSFVSDEGGIYVTVLKHYTKAPYPQNFEILQNACVAVCRTVEAFGLKPRIRWANDVLVGDLKISGTLIENVCTNVHIVRSIVGIGLNVNNVLPAELTSIATTMQQQLGHSLPLKAVQKKFIKSLQQTYSLAEYKQYIDWLGQTVQLKTDGEAFYATALNIEQDGSLLVQRGGKEQKIYCGEMTLRL